VEPGSEDPSGEGVRIKWETPRNKYAKDQDPDTGERRSGWCSLLGVWVWWLLTINSHDLEISISRGVE